ncbi:MAG TPA: ATPase domain-containing protein, partial [Planctomycetota bacterium]|nr:ATPase domain-containing protein [Planctomycetota bacterium]
MTKQDTRDAPATGRPPAPPSAGLIGTGIAGLDDVLGGGLPPHHVYLVAGDPGVGKTTLALQFLLEGVRRGETGLYITLSETQEELKAVAASHRWDLGRLGIFELTALEQKVRTEAQNTFYLPSEIELSKTVTGLLQEIERRAPQRVVFDSMAEIRLLAENPLRYRREILALKQFFIGRHTTALLIDDRTSEAQDSQLRTLAHGVIELEQLHPEYGAEKRRLRVTKLRGVRYRGGHHDYSIQTGGLVVYPRLVASEHRGDLTDTLISSGLPALDTLLGEGLNRGTSTLLLGGAGTGKSVLCSQYAVAAADRGERTSVFLFDERYETFLLRSRNLRMPVDDRIRAGKMTVHQIDPSEKSPGEFSTMVREAVEGGSKLVVIDSVNGYIRAMPEERYLLVHLHELLSYLGQKGVTTLFTLAQHGLVASDMSAPTDLSYLADTVVLLRYFEIAGEVKKSIAIVKKRTGRHENSIREFEITADGIHVGPPLKG